MAKLMHKWCCERRLPLVKWTLAEGQETSLQVFQIEDQTKGAKKSLSENPVTMFVLIIVLKMIKYSTTTPPIPLSFI